MDGSRRTFILKLWEEQREIVDAPPIQRGSVEDASSGKRMYFSSLAELCDLLARYTGFSVAPSDRTQ